MWAPSFYHLPLMISTPFRVQTCQQMSQSNKCGGPDSISKGQGLYFCHL